MAVVLITHSPKYQCLSTDTKPTGVTPGSRLIETDTKDEYTTYDGTNWTKYKRNSDLDMTSECRRNKIWLLN